MNIFLLPGTEPDRQDPNGDLVLHLSPGENFLMILIRLNKLMRLCGIDTTFRVFTDVDQSTASTPEEAEASVKQIQGEIESMDRQRALRDTQPRGVDYPAWAARFESARELRLNVLVQAKHRLALLNYSTKEEIIKLRRQVSGLEAQGRAKDAEIESLKGKIDVLKADGGFTTGETARIRDAAGSDHANTIIKFLEDHRKIVKAFGAPDINAIINRIKKPIRKSSVGHMQRSIDAIHVCGEFVRFIESLGIDHEHFPPSVVKAYETARMMKEIRTSTLVDDTFVVDEEYVEMLKWLIECGIDSGQLTPAENL